MAENPKVRRPRSDGRCIHTLTLPPLLLERLLPLFGSHRSRVAAATASPRGCWLPRSSWRSCAWQRSAPSQAVLCGRSWRRCTRLASISRLFLRPSPRTVGQQTLQPMDLLSIRRLMGIRPWCFLSWLEVIEFGLPRRGTTSPLPVLSRSPMLSQLRMRSTTMR